ncbi:MAG: DUF559 domain-containing protein [Chloroflexi bacterium]|nr:DUF559 domain-containing protein [Chloroflexota bacterium]
MSYIFISYARKDHFFVDRLRDDLKRAGVEYWIDHEGLSPGTTSWERTIRRAIKDEDCVAVLWIVSPASFESPYVRDEIAIARLYGRTIYPVWADGQNWLECVPLGTGEIQYIDARSDYEAARQKILDALHVPSPDYALPAETTPALAHGVEPRNPYKGLFAFGEADAGDFFGRAAAVSRLVAALERRLSEGGDRFLAVLGPSGAGKSSLVMAGLIPALKRGAVPGSQSWTYLPKIVPGAHPVEVLADALKHELPQMPLSAIETDLRSPGGRYLHRLAKQLPGGQAVLYIDQFEEVFTLVNDEAERQQFIDLITHAATEPGDTLAVLLTMRADFYGHPLNYPLLGALVNASSEAVLPMSIAELREAIESPARLPDVALTFDDGLVAEIIFVLRDQRDGRALAGVLPLLEFTLARLFAERDGARLTQAAYEAMGGVLGAIGTHCEAVFSKLPAGVQAQLGRVFLPLVNIDEASGEPTRRRAPLETVGGGSDARALVQTLVNNRLLQTGLDGGEPYLEIIHEALFRSWERLKLWIAETQEDLILLRQVRGAAAEWDKKGCPDYLLWPAERLKLVYAMIERLQPELNEVERDFIEPEQARLLRELETLPPTAASHQRRRDIGDRLSAIGDTRPGVGVIALSLNPSAQREGLSSPLPAQRSGEGPGVRAVPDMLWLPVAGSGGKVVEFQDQAGEVYGEFDVRDFYIAKYLVTYAQFQTFLDAPDGFADDRWWKGMPRNDKGREMVQQRTKIANAPRDNVNGYQAVAFARWLDFKYRELGLFEQFEALTPNPSPGGEGLKGYREMAARVMVQIARELRQRQTSAEELLWECLRDRRLNDLEFRRRHPVANTAFVVDFFCHDCKLAVELDGGIHVDQQQEDQWRLQALEDAGIRVIRFSNEAVFNNLEQVLIDIQRAAAASPLSPGRGAGGEGRTGAGCEVWQIRLPTEWEWQWAVQNGAEAQAYPWGGWQEGHANTSEAGLNRTMAVGMYPHGAAGCGALDMAGNLWEWCLSEPKHLRDARDPLALRVLRGGSWNVNQRDARAASRHHVYFPLYGSDFWGCRVVVGCPI